MAWKQNHQIQHIILNKRKPFWQSYYALVCWSTKNHCGKSSRSYQIFKNSLAIKWFSKWYMTNSNNCNELYQPKKRGCSNFTFRLNSCQFFRVSIKLLQFTLRLIKSWSFQIFIYRNDFFNFWDGQRLKESHYIFPKYFKHLSMAISEASALSCCKN